MLISRELNAAYWALRIALLLAIWNHFHTQIMSVVHTIWNAVSGFFKATWKDIQDVAKAAWNLFRKYVIDPVEAAWHRIEEVWAAVEKVLGDVWTRIKKAVSDAWAHVKSAIIDPITDAWHQVESVGDSIWHAISNAFDQAWHAVEHIGDRFLSIGNDIVMGIVHGVEHAGGALFKSLGDLANNALKSAKSFLGISSPSKLFSEQVGQWIPHGIAAGVANAAGVAQDAVAAMVGGLAVEPKFSVTGGLSYAMAGDASPLAGVAPITGGRSPLIASPPLVTGGAVSTAGPIEVRVYLDGDELRNVTIRQAQRNKLRNGHSLLT